jgi:alpha-tubulin suppressor-like RCC1 family protein
VGRTAQAPYIAVTGATHIEAGGGHTCALVANGYAYCWGDGSKGQVGAQYGVWSSSPTYSEGYVLGPKDPNTFFSTLPPLSFTSISAGGSSTCGTTLTATYCWGQQGNPTDPWSSASVPTLITGSGQASYGNFGSLAVGNLHSCAIDWATGLSACWSAQNGDTYGQAGQDPLNFPAPGIVPFFMSTALQGGISRIATQQDFTCADMWNNTVQCFGYNADGELGHGPAYPSYSTYQPQVVGSNGRMQLYLHGVSTGWKHACALDVNTSYAWCWGLDDHGQLGNGKDPSVFYGPVQVGPVSINYVNQTFGATIAFRAIAAGAYHTCGIGQDNHIYCWGDNSLRQLGRDIYNASGVATITTYPVQTM